MQLADQPSDLRPPPRAIFASCRHGTQPKPDAVLTTGRVASAALGVATAHAITHTPPIHSSTSPPLALACNLFIPPPATWQTPEHAWLLAALGLWSSLPACSFPQSSKHQPELSPVALKGGVQGRGEQRWGGWGVLMSEGEDRERCTAQTERARAAAPWRTSTSA